MEKCQKAFPFPQYRGYQVPPWRTRWNSDRDTFLKDITQGETRVIFRFYFTYSQLFIKNSIYTVFGILLLQILYVLGAIGAILCS